MNKIKITSKQKLEFQRHFTEILSRLNYEGENIPYNCMFRIKAIIKRRESIIIEEMFEVIEK